MRAEITAREKLALGQLMGAYTSGENVVRVTPDNPMRATFDALTRRGEWVVKTSDDEYKITNYGMSAFYTAKVVKS